MAAGKGGRGTGREASQVSGSKLALPASFAEDHEWEALNRRLQGIDPQDPVSLRDAVAFLFETIAELFEPHLQDFESFREAELMEGALARSEAVRRSEVTVNTRGEPRRVLLDAARLLRALEENLVEFGREVESDLGEDLEDAWRTSDGSFYVIPRVTPLVPLEGRAFLRRALLHHRVLPTSVNKFAVRLHRTAIRADSAEAGRDAASSERRYGVAFFPGLSVGLVAPPPSATEFLVDRIEGVDLDRIIDEQAARWEEAGCRAVVWPELTIPPPALARLRFLLEERSLDASPLHYLVAGSWHQIVGSEMRNVAPVIDGFGQPLFDVYKWAKFKIANRYEAIVPGHEIHVLICEGELVVFAICRDFLQETKDPPYRQLNVDVAIVPSMTSALPDLQTMKGHAATANAMRVRYGTRTLVVAQPSSAAAEGVGEVLAFPDRPLAESPQRVDVAFEVRSLE